MRQVGGTDSLFFAMETDEIHGHVGGLVILDPSEAPHFSFDRVAATFAERLRRIGPEFVSRLEEAPLGLARPWLVPDPHFDLRHHVRRIAVPSPGDFRALADLCGYLHGQKLDRRRPLWELWLIEGLEGGRCAIFSKTHHALMDGSKGADLSMAVLDLEPDPAPEAAPPAPAELSGEAPGAFALALDGVANLAATPWRLAGWALQALRRGVSMAPYLVGESASPIATAVPKLSFNGAIGPQRAFAFTSLDLAEVKAVKDALGVKMNDVVLEICGSAMRRYLDATGETFEGELTVSCPVSTRAAGDTEANRLANMLVGCASGIADPIERVRRIHENATRAKAMTAATRSTPIRPIGEVLPPAILNLGVRAGSALAAWAPIPINAVVSNVPGPSIPLYCAGARIEGVYPFSILATSQGLNFTVLSFMDRLDVGLTVDPDAVPDPWLLASCVDDAWDELREATRPLLRGRSPARAGDRVATLARSAPPARAGLPGGRPEEAREESALARAAS